MVTSPTFIHSYSSRTWTYHSGKDHSSIYCRRKCVKSLHHCCLQLTSLHTQRVLWITTISLKMPAAEGRSSFCPARVCLVLVCFIHQNVVIFSFQIYTMSSAGLRDGERRGNVQTETKYSDPILIMVWSTFYFSCDFLMKCQTPCGLPHLITHALAQGRLLLALILVMLNLRAFGLGISLNACFRILI